MKKGGIYTGYVESVDFPNKGNVIVKTEEDGQTIEEKAVVKNSIPGQVLHSRMLQVRMKLRNHLQRLLISYITLRNMPRLVQSFLRVHF